MEAVILAGGLGTRLRSVVSELPKCLAPVGGRPFLEYLLAYLAGSGFTRVVLSVGYLKEAVMDFVNGREWPFEVAWAVEEEPLGTGGAIRLALSECIEDKVFILNGDSFFPVDFGAMSLEGPVGIALKPMRHFSRYGAVRTRSGKVVAFSEKAFCEEGLINGGVYVVDRKKLDMASLGAKFSFEKDVLEPLSGEGIIDASVQDRYFIDIGIPEDFERAQYELPEYFSVKRASEEALLSGASTLFLDRDGVVNRHLPGDYVRSWSMFAFLPGVLEEFPKWARSFNRIVMVTNQRGVGKGLMSDEDLADIHSRMQKEIEAAGGRLDAIFACTSLSEDDPSRKPNTGMFESAAALFPDIEARDSVMIGDSASDAEFASRCGMRFILV